MYMYGHYWEVKGGGVKGGANHVSQKIKPQFIYASPISMYLKKKKNISLQSGKSTQLFKLSKSHFIRKKTLQAFQV